MKIAVIAAQGRSGSVFVEAALNAGHSVRAGIRGKRWLPEHPNLTVITCDASKEEDLRELIKGQQAVVSLIGHVKGSPARIQTDATTRLVNLMQEMNIKRVISLTGTGVRFPKDKISLIDHFMNYGVTLIDPNRVEDGRQHAEALKECSLDWTLIRVLKLKNGSAGEFSLSEHGPAKTFVSRKEVAQAILQVLEKKSFIKQAPVISN